MATIALATSEGYENLTPDDRLLLEPLRSRGVEARPVRWDAPVDWATFDAVLVRSTWDYYRRPDEFAAWIEARGSNGPKTWNSPAVLRWNMDKRYLEPLRAAGVSVVETAWVDRGTTASLPTILSERGWRRAVVKPGVSAGAWKTFVVDDPSSDAAAADFSALVAECDVLVQPFLDAVVDEGEWSVVFVDGEHVSTLLKTAGEGDFRVQERHGGSTRLVPEAPPDLIAQAREVLGHAPGELLYARVDGVRSGGRLIVMELEVLEPVLFFGIAPRAADALARAVFRRL